MRTRLHRSEINMLLGKLARGHGIKVSYRAIERALGFPLAEANHDQLRGIIAALDAINQRDPS